MSRYQPKPVDAFRWTGGPDQTEDPVWLVDAIKAGEVGLFKQGGVVVGLVIVFGRGEYLINPGDYVILDAVGQISACDPEVFVQLFDLVE